MPAPRDWMTLTIAPCGRHAPQPAHVPTLPMRPFAPGDAERLAQLMLDSYRGSVDDSGETLDDARREVAKLIAGEFGPLDTGASLVAEHSGELVSATIVTRDRVAPLPLAAGEAFLAFSMTAAAWKRRGLARAGLSQVIGVLRSREEPRLHLVVTRTNTPAMALYRSFGFAARPVGAGINDHRGRRAAATEAGGRGAKEDGRSPGSMTS